MRFARSSAIWLLLGYLAALGYLLVTLPPKVVEQFHATAAYSPAIAYVYLAVVMVGTLLLGGISVWLLARMFGNSYRKARRRQQRQQDPRDLSPGQQRQEMERNLAETDQFTRHAELDARLAAEIRDRIDKIESKREAQQLHIVAFGTISSGKSSLLNALLGRDVFRSDVLGGTTATSTEVPWPGPHEVMLTDTPGLAEVAGAARASQAAATARDADLVLFVVDGPLKEYERSLLMELTKMEKRVIICLNKTDWFAAEQRDALLGQIRHQVAEHVASPDVVAVRSQVQLRTRMRVQPDGSEQAEEVCEPANIQPLAARMLSVIEQDGRELLLANLLLQSRGLVDDAKENVLATLDARAEKIIRKYMWASGGIAGVNPIPLLDLAGGGALAVKMVMDLAENYAQRVDADTIVAMLGELGKNLVTMLGTVAATPALVAAVGTLLKTIPGVGTLAGGLLQGSVQALVTRWIGRVFCEYFRRDMQPPPGGLAELARRKWREITSPAEIRALVTTGKLGAAAAETPVPSSASEEEHPR